MHMIFELLTVVLFEDCSLPGHDVSLAERFSVFQGIVVPSSSRTKQPGPFQFWTV